MNFDGTTHFGSVIVAQYGADDCRKLPESLPVSAGQTTGGNHQNVRWGDNRRRSIDMKTTRTLIAAAALIGVVSAVPAFAVDEYNVSKGTTVDGQGVAFRANDVVALVSGLGIVPGQAKHTYVHDGVAYYFASEETMTQFAAEPEKYMPRYGGYCAFGVAKGKKLDGSPRFADIVDGKLYLFLNAAVYRAYEQDKEGVLAQAEKNWPGMHHISVADVNGIGS